MQREVTTPCGIDVHKRTATVCVRATDAETGEMKSLRRTVDTMTEDLLELRDWLKGLGVTHVAMEATGVYWKPVYYVLEDDFEVLLCNAAHMKNVPGRKTDVIDAEWIAELLEYGLLRPSFVPPPEIRRLRDLTRHRRTLVEEKSRSHNRLQKLLEDANLKLASVVTDITGVSSRAMLRAMIEGERDPAVLAGMAKGKLKAKRRELERALTGRLQDHHVMLLGMMLDQIDYLASAIDKLSARIDSELDEIRTKADLLKTIPGVADRTAEIILAELGPDMDRFPTDRHAAAWAGLCPSNNESAGKRRSTRIRHGNAHLRSALTEAALAAIRTKGTHLRSRYYRIRQRAGHKRAIIAVAHSILRAAYHMLRDGEPFRDLGEDYYDKRQDPKRRAKRLVGQLERLGYSVSVSPETAQPATSAA